MSGDWLSVDIDLRDKPKVRKISRALGIDRDAVVGKLIAVWGWFDRNSVDGLVDAVDADVDDLARHDGFANAMAGVGWLVIDGEKHRISVPDFDVHHSNSAKKRLLKSARQRRWRANSAENTVDALVVQVPSTNVDARSRLQAPTTEQNSKEQKKEQEPRAVDIEKAPSAAGLACKAIMAAGIQANPSHPSLVAAITEGTTTQEFADAATECKALGKGFAYLLAMVRRRKAETAAPVAQTRAPKPAAHEPAKPETRHLTPEQRAANKKRLDELLPGLSP